MSAPVSRSIRERSSIVIFRFGARRAMAYSMIRTGPRVTMMRPVCPSFLTYSCQAANTATNNDDAESFFGKAAHFV